MERLKLLWEFYKSVFLINLFLMLVSLKFNPYTILVNLCVVAIAVIYIYKKYYRENEYYFYYNQSITKLFLFAFCFGLNFIISSIILLILWNI